MSAHDAIPPEVALRNFLQVISNEAEQNPAFRNRLLQVLSVPVIYEGEEELTRVDPHIVAAQKSELQFRAAFGGLPLAKLKDVLKKNGLATAPDMAKKTAPELIDMLWSRAKSRAEERGLL